MLGRFQERELLLDELRAHAAGANQEAVSARTTSTAFELGRRYKSMKRHLTGAGPRRRVLAKWGVRPEYQWDAAKADA